MCMTSVLLTLGLNITSLFYICAGQIKTNRWLISFWIFVGIYNLSLVLLLLVCSIFYCCLLLNDLVFPWISDFMCLIQSFIIYVNQSVIIFRNKSQFFLKKSIKKCFFKQNICSSMIRNSFWTVGLAVKKIISFLRKKAFEAQFKDCWKIPSLTPVSTIVSFKFLFLV